MDAARWHRIEQLFDHAIELATGARGAYLDTACDGDPELRREVDGLLASAAATGTPLRDAIAAEARLLAGGAVTAQVGRRIGGWL